MNNANRGCGGSGGNGDDDNALAVAGTTTRGYDFDFKKSMLRDFDPTHMRCVIDRVQVQLPAIDLRHHAVAAACMHACTRRQHLALQ